MALSGQPLGHAHSPQNQGGRNHRLMMGDGCGLWEIDAEHPTPSLGHSAVRRPTLVQVTGDGVSEGKAAGAHGMTGQLTVQTQRPQKPAGRLWVPKIQGAEWTGRGALFPPSQCTRPRVETKWNKKKKAPQPPGEGAGSLSHG